MWRWPCPTFSILAEVVDLPPSAWTRRAPEHAASRRASSAPDSDRVIVTTTRLDSGRAWELLGPDEFLSPGFLSLGAQAVRVAHRRRGPRERGQVGTGELNFADVLDSAGQAGSAAGSLVNRHDMQRGPPRPPPSSLAGTG